MVNARNSDSTRNSYSCREGRGVKVYPSDDDLIQRKKGTDIEELSGMGIQELAMKNKVCALEDRAVVEAVFREAVGIDYRTLLVLLASRNECYSKP